MKPENKHAKKLYIAVGIGGMVGAVGRYGISILFAGVTGFPFATLTANLLGCFLLSFLLNHRTVKKKLSTGVFAALGTGMIGAFTTFSTFAVETMELWSTGMFMAVGYVLLSVLGGLAFCYGGFRLAAGKEVRV